MQGRPPQQMQQYPPQQMQQYPPQQMQQYPPQQYPPQQYPPQQYPPQQYPPQQRPPQPQPPQQRPQPPQQQQYQQQQYKQQQYAPQYGQQITYVTLPYQFVNPQPVQPVFGPENQLLYSVKGRPAFSYLDVYLNPNQKITGDSGTMLWMDGNVPMQTGCPGGCMNSCYRTCSGETCFQNTFTGPGKVSFGSHKMGELLPFVVTPGNGWIITRSSYICGSQNLKVNSRFTGCGACCCGREGAFLTRVSVLEGAGVFFGGQFGMLERNEVPAGKQFIVDAGMFFAAHELAELSIGIVGGCTGFCCSGEGFVLKFTGPCVIYTKSRDYERFLDRVTPSRTLENIAHVIEKIAENSPHQ